MPLATISRVESPLTTRPSSLTSPLLGATIPRMVFSVVVFPLAFPPRRHTISPRWISTLTPRNTLTSP